MNALISVIVPVYNVEKYLDKCVQSIVNQTYSNLDIILVDDGSPDCCGLMCDLWAEKDERIQVIHQRNGGLSQARNMGIEESKGQYLMFVDSDDYITENMIELLYRAIIKTQAEISLCNFLYVDENGNSITRLNDSNKPVNNEVLSGFDTLKVFGKKGGVNFVVAWNKLYKKELFSDIKYPKGKIHEDTFTAHHLLGDCNKIACISDYCYFYVQREGSIMSSTDLKGFLDGLEANIDRSIYFNSKGIKDRSSYFYYEVGMKMNNIHELCMSDNNLKTQFEQLMKHYRQNIYLCRYCSVKQIIQVIVFCINPTLFRKIQQIV